MTIPRLSVTGVTGIPVANQGDDLAAMTLQATAVSDSFAAPPAVWSANIAGGGA